LANAAPAAAAVANDVEVDQVESDGSELAAHPDPHLGRGTTGTPRRLGD